MPERVPGNTTLHLQSHMRDVSHGLIRQDPLKMPCLPYSRQAHEVWNEIKPEYYGILSRFTYNVVKRACETRAEREPFGLIQVDIDENNRTYKPSSLKTRTAINRYNPFGDLQNLMGQTLHVALIDEMHDIREVSSHPLLPALKRMEAIEYRMAQIFPVRASNPEITLQRGINTATDFMLNLLRVIPHVANHNDPEALMQIARNSFSIVAQAAMSNIGIFTSVDEGFKGRDAFEAFFDADAPFNSWYFTIKGDGKNSYLAFSPEGEDLLREKTTNFEKKCQKLGIDPEITPGCPGMRSFNGESAVRLLWDWHLDIAQHIYQQLPLNPPAHL